MKRSGIARPLHAHCTWKAAAPRLLVANQQLHDANQGMEVCIRGFRQPNKFLELTPLRKDGGGRRGQRTTHQNLRNGVLVMTSCLCSVARKEEQRVTRNVKRSRRTNTTPLLHLEYDDLREGLHSTTQAKPITSLSPRSATVLTYSEAFPILPSKARS